METLTNSHSSTVRRVRSTYECALCLSQYCLKAKIERTYRNARNAERIPGLGQQHDHCEVSEGVPSSCERKTTFICSAWLLPPKATSSISRQPRTPLGARRVDSGIITTFVPHSETIFGHHCCCSIHRLNCGTSRPRSVPWRSKGTTPR